MYITLNSVQRANELVDAENLRVDLNHKHWRKLKSSSKEEQFSPWVPRDILYITQFIHELFSVKLLIVCWKRRLQCLHILKW